MWRQEDWQSARRMPILAVCRQLGLTPRAGKISCFGNHTDKTPSLHIYEKDNRWYCFGCSLHGSVIDLVAGIQKISASDAIAWLLGQTRLPPQRTPLVRHLMNPKRLARPNTRIFDWLMEQNPLGERGRAYLLSRGFTPETLAKFTLGEIADPNRTIEDGASTWGEAQLLEAGIVRRTDRAIKLLFAADTILFGFKENGKLTYVQGRAIAADAPFRWIGPVNLKKPLFNSDVLQAMRPGQLIHLCEGVTDTMAATQLGWLAVGALGASSLTAELASKFDGMSVILLPDGDSGGSTFEHRARSIFSAQNTYLQVRRLPPGTDVADTIRNHRNVRRVKAP